MATKISKEKKTQEILRHKRKRQVNLSKSKLYQENKFIQCQNLLFYWMNINGIKWKPTQCMKSIKICNLNNYSKENTLQSLINYQLTSRHPRPSKHLPLQVTTKSSINTNNCKKLFTGWRPIFRQPVF